MIDPTGTYEVDGLAIRVFPHGTGWKVEYAGVPAGFEPTLNRIDGTGFEMLRGPMGGAILEFDDADGGHMGPMSFHRSNRPYSTPPGYGLSPPPIAADEARDARFDELLRSNAEGGRLSWDLPYPKHEFVAWATAQDRYIFHSSTNVDIDEFQPIRQSMELMDRGGRGNLGAVYGTHDGYWSMFFGIVDRPNLRGSIRNGVYRWEAEDGRVVTTYQFSLEQNSLVGKPFTSGAIYLLPRASFRRLHFYPDGPISDEWASEEAVRPIASLLIDPEDFPFLDRIAGHDESEYLHMLDLFWQFLAGLVSYEVGDGIEVSLDWSPDADRAYAEWADLADRYIPVVAHSLQGDGQNRVLRLEGPPPYIAVVAKRLGEIMGESQ